MSSTPQSIPWTTRVRRLASVRGRYRTLHLTMFAFFLSFVVWFNVAPFAKAIASDLHLSKTQMATILLCNIALTVPARIAVGMLLDRFGPRRMFGGLLLFAAVPNTIFALSSSFDVLVISRLLVGVVGAGFVVGIRMVAEWFEDEEIGLAEGFYGGWGNFGSAAAALGLPVLAAAIVGGTGAWRWGIGLSGVVGAVYGLVYLFVVQDSPEGRPFARPRLRGALEVTSRGAAIALAVMQVPIFGVLILVAYRLEYVHVIAAGTFWAIVFVLLGTLALQVRTVLWSNRPALRNRPVVEPWDFRPVVLLSLAYAVTFGAELTVVSMLPTFFADTFGLQIAAAGAAGSAFGFTNLVTRPGGGLLSDAARSRKAVLVVLLVGSAASFAVLSGLDHGWPLAAGIALVALTSIFVQGGNGAVFAMVPQLNRRSGGQVAGLVGAYGNVGGLAFTSILFFGVGSPGALFLVVAAAALIVGLACTAMLPSAREVSLVPVRGVARGEALAQSPGGA